MKPLAFFNYITKIQRNTAIAQQRCLLVLNGNKAWATNLLTQLPNFPLCAKENTTPRTTNTEHKWLVFSNVENTNGLTQTTKEHLIVTGKNYRYHLGSECNYLLFDGDNFHIDAFAALSGTIKAGGLLYLLWPDDGELSSRFLQRFYQQLIDDVNVIFIEPCQNSLKGWQSTDHGLFSKNKLFCAQPENENHENFAHGCVTAEQVLAVHAIEKVFLGHRNRPLVLTADRGRGKSSALAIACVNIMKQAKQSVNIVITAPHQQSLAVFFQQLKKSLPTSYLTKHQMIYQQNNVESKVTFIPVDKLLDEKINMHLLLVDEASAIPVYLLAQFLRHYHRIVFSTTLHGYEGAGRGFTLKFKQVLQTLRPEFKELHIHQPIRWAKNDPLERFVFNSCLLNAPLPEVPIQITRAPIDYNELCFKQLKASDLSKDEILLSQVFSVLVTAHYQTSPSDLQLMLDNNKVSILVLQLEKKIVAVALLIAEGDCSAEYVDAISGNKRRLKNQFTPQSLLTYCGFTQAFNYSYLRIMRIAVHPSLQRQGIGRYFLQQLTDFAQTKSVDFLATSFGANTSLLSFWLTDNYIMARVGFTKDQASGEHSALLLKTLNERSATFNLHIQQYFYRSFSYLLTDEYRDLSAQVVAIILSYCPEQFTKPLTLYDQQMIEAFANKKQLYASCVYSLHLALLRYFSTHKNHDHQAALVMIARILQKHDLSTLCQKYSFNGKKAFNQYMIDFVNTYLKGLYL